MREGIHPTWYSDAQVQCACGNTWTTGSTQKVIRTEMCSQCHPFYTGEQRIVDTEGQVDRFYKRLQARQDYLQEKKDRAAELISPDRPLDELGMNKRAIDALSKAGIENAGQALEALGKGDPAILAIDGFGRKSLADLKKGLRKFGYPMPETAEEIAA